jgi:hypothetical protein
MNHAAVGKHVSHDVVRWLWTLAAFGGLAFALGAVFQPQRLWPNLFLLGFLSVGFGLGGLLLIAFHELAGARWDQGLHGVRESMAATLPWVAPVLAVILVAGLSSYPRVAHGHARRANRLVQTLVAGTRLPYGPGDRLPDDLGSIRRGHGPNVAA